MGCPKGKQWATGRNGKIDTNHGCTTIEFGTRDPSPLSCCPPHRRRTASSPSPPSPPLAGTKPASAQVSIVLSLTVKKLLIIAALTYLDGVDVAPGELRLLQPPGLHQLVLLGDSIGSNPTRRGTDSTKGEVRWEWITGATCWVQVPVTIGSSELILKFAPSSANLAGWGWGQVRISEYMWG